MTPLQRHHCIGFCVTPHSSISCWGFVRGQKSEAADVVACGAGTHAGDHAVDCVNDRDDTESKWLRVWPLPLIWRPSLLLI